MDLETDSEDLNKTLISGEGIMDKDEKTMKEAEEAKNSREIQLKERPEDPEEDADMLTSDGGSEDLELEEVLA